MARIALFEALVEPLPERIHALLFVAGAFPHREEALTALTACLHLLERDTLENGEYGSRKGIRMKEETYLSCTSLLEKWRDGGWDDPRIDLCESLLLEYRKKIAIRCLAQTGPPIYLQSPGRHDEIPLRAPLVEEVRILVHDVDYSPGDALIHDRSEEYLRRTLTPFVKGDLEQDPHSEDLLLPGRSDPNIAAPRPGTYLMEARSVSKDWSRMQVLIVTDLDLTTQSCADGFALLATLRGIPASGVEIRRAGPGAGCEEGTVIGCTDDQGLLVAPFPEDMEKDSLLLVGRKGSHRKTVLLARSGSFREIPPEVRAHLFCDRPIYRPGETVSGRLLVRRHDSRLPLKGLLGSTVDSEPLSSPLADRAVVVEFVHGEDTKQRFHLRTDSFGAACFSIRLPLTTPMGSTEVRAWVPLDRENEFRWAASKDDDRGPHASLGSWSSAFDIQEYKRPPLLWEVEWPEARQRKDSAPAVSISARYPSGAPACGLKGRFAASVNQMEQTVPFVLDSRGRATVILAAEELDLPPGKVEIDCRVSITAADGQTLTEQNRIVFVPDSWFDSDSSPRSAGRNLPAHARHRDRDTRLRLSFPKERWSAGEPLPVSLTGPPGAPVLLTIGRASLLDARVVTLDLAGSADLFLPTSREWFPRVYLSAAVPACFCRYLSHVAHGGEGRGRNDDNHLGLFACDYLTLEEPAGQLQISLKKNASTYGPGEKVSWTIVTSDSEGKPLPATVAVSVLDERLARLMDDTRKNAGSALYPRWWWDRTIYRRGAMHRDREEVFETLIRKGEVISPFTRVGGSARSAGCGFGGRRKPADAKPRVTFRKTAFFDGSILTGSDGRAEIEFTLPDDLTTWRIVLVAVDRGRQAALLEETVETRRDPAVTPLLPRILRRGDRVSVPILVQSVENGLPPAGRIFVEAEGSLHVEPGGSGMPFPSVPGTSVTRTSVTRTAIVHGNAEGQGLFRATVRNGRGDTLDQVDLGLGVRSREIRRTLYSVTSVKEEVFLDPPRVDGKGPTGLSLEIVGGVPALIRKAKKFLDDYPYGCAEQVSSCMTPALIMLHPELGRDSDRPLSAERARRLEVGMNRLRRYQNHDGGFTWWGGGSTDPQISACVLRFLAFAKEAGLRVEDHGIRLDPESPLFVRNGDRLDRALASQVEWTSERMAWAEIAVCRLVLFPGHGAAGETCRALTPFLSDLPSGLLARLGLAQIAAGEKGVVEKIALILRKRIEERIAGLCGRDSLLESPASRLAAMVEFFLAARPDDPLRQRLVAMLLGCFGGDRFDHTFGTASALVALSREEAAFPNRADVDSCVVQVAASGFSKELVLRADGGWQAACPIPAGRGRLTLTNRSGPALQAILRADFVEDGAAALRLAHPIEVSRRLVRLLPDETGAMIRREEARKIRAGEIVEAIITVRNTGLSRYLVVECPLPAGFEVIRGKEHLEVRDDRVVLCVRAAEEIIWRPRFQVAAEGQVSWPPARAADMYDRECWGHSAGCLLDVEPASAVMEPLEPVRILTRREMENRVSRIRKPIARATCAKEAADAMLEEAALPISIQKEWSFTEAPRLVGGWLDDQRLADVYVNSLGSLAEERFQGDRLEEILALAGEKRASTLLSLARALEKRNHGRWALDMLREKSGLNADEIRLFTLVVFLDDEYLYDDGLLAFYGRFSSFYGDVPLKIRLEALMDRLDNVEDLTLYADEELKALRLSEIARLYFWAWERVDLDGKAYLASSLEDLLRYTYEGKNGSIRLPPRSVQNNINTGLKQRAKVAVFDGLGRLAGEGWIEPEDFWENISALLYTASEDQEKKEVQKLIAGAASRILELSAQRGREHVFLNAADRFLWSLTEDQRRAGGAECLDALIIPLLYFSMGSEAKSLGLDSDCWDLLSRGTKASLPCSTLLYLVLNEEEEWAADELLKRRGADRKALLTALPQIGDSYIRDAILRKVPVEVLCSLPPSTVIHLVPGEERWRGRKAVELWKSLRQSISRGPWTNEKIARMLSRSRNPDLRFLAVQVLADRGRREVSFSADDRAAPLYRNLLLARLGDGEAREALRAILFGAERMWEDWELFDIVWALEPSIDPAELIRLNRAYPGLSVPPFLLRPILSRVESGRLFELLQSGDLKHEFIHDLADALPEEKIRQIGSMLLELDLQRQPYRLCDRVFSALTRDEPTLRKFLLSAPRLSYFLVHCLISEQPRNSWAGVALTGSLLNHEEKRLRSESLSYLQRSLGDPRTWLPQGVAVSRTAEYCLDAVVRLRMAVFRDGIAALEDSLQSTDPLERGAARILLARFGLDLSPRGR